MFDKLKGLFSGDDISGSEAELQALEGREVALQAKLDENEKHRQSETYAAVEGDKKAPDRLRAATKERRQLIAELQNVRATTGKIRAELPAMRQRVVRKARQAKIDRLHGLLDKRIRLAGVVGHALDEANKALEAMDDDATVREITSLYKALRVVDVPEGGNAPVIEPRLDHPPLIRRLSMHMYAGIWRYLLGLDLPIDKSKCVPFPVSEEEACRYYRITDEPEKSNAAPSGQAILAAGAARGGSSSLITGVTAG